MAKGKQHNSDLLVVLLLFFVYTICALLLCVVGVNSYGKTVAVLQEGYDQRTGILYVAQKVHQNDIGGGVRVEDYEGATALVLTEQETGTGYETWIVVREGYLCEQLIAPGGQLVHEQMQIIMPMQAMVLVLGEDNIMRVELTTESGAIHTMSIALRSSGSAYNATGETPARSSFNEESLNDSGGAAIMNNAASTIMGTEPSDGGAQ